MVMETEQNIHYNIQILLFYAHYRVLHIHKETQMVRKRKPGIRDCVYVLMCMFVAPIIFRRGKGTDAADERSPLNHFRRIAVRADLHLIEHIQIKCVCHIQSVGTWVLKLVDDFCVLQKLFDLAILLKQIYSGQKDLLKDVIGVRQGFCCVQLFFFHILQQCHAPSSKASS